MIFNFSIKFYIIIFLNEDLGNLADFSNNFSKMSNTSACVINEKNKLARLATFSYTINYKSFIKSCFTKRICIQ